MSMTVTRAHPRLLPHRNSRILTHPPRGYSHAKRGAGVTPSNASDDDFEWECGIWYVMFPQFIFPIVLMVFYQASRQPLIHVSPLAVISSAGTIYDVYVSLSNTINLITSTHSPRPRCLTSVVRKEHLRPTMPRMQIPLRTRDRRRPHLRARKTFRVQSS